MSAENFVNAYAEMGIEQDFIPQAIANRDGAASEQIRDDITVILESKK